MKNNSGVTLVTMVLMIIIMVIIASVSIIGGREIIQNSKESKITESLTAVKSAVNNISIKLSTAGTLTPANIKLYGEPAVETLSGDSVELANWYILDESDLKELGIEYADKKYLVNYAENKVMLLDDYQAE